ncbi:uncharacterized protein LOC112568369 [Pomacea canaliculata]|uniref:uncharacterized protein LOC112568369 n=1 Tax=Pomacea canaliculata TaxID=400727 RepID=UPI000D73CCE9|nr:uncharacterized protein LOC112568369 [Pomacea canaliculata]
MTTTHQLMAAAFCLCGLLFLYHVDSVNSLSCKTCDETDPNCYSGDVADEDCEPDRPYCTITDFKFPNELQSSKIFRGCSEDSLNECKVISTELSYCSSSCETDGCNNEPKNP